jgi:hypothetical protein
MRDHAHPAPRVIHIAGEPVTLAQLAVTTAATGVVLIGLWIALVVLIGGWG